MKQLLRADPVAQDRADGDDPLRYGWRYVRRVQPDGTEVIDQVPLSLEDLLYPEEDDFVVQEPVHTRDFLYCYSTLETFYATQPDVVVLGDCRVDWGGEGVRPLGPDIVVFFDVREWLRRATFQRAEEGGRPALIMEIASPSTRVHDLGAKLDLSTCAEVFRHPVPIFSRDSWVFIPENIWSSTYIIGWECSST